MKRIIYTLIKLVVAIALLLGGMASCNYYLAWSAERKAQAFCDSIAPGSDISLAIARVDDESGYKKVDGGKVSALHYGFPEEGFADYSHTFLFPAFGFDKAYCDVTLTKDGKVVSKNSYFQAD